jgi:addiction module RelE/StbE family toxin
MRLRTSTKKLPMKNAPRIEYSPLFNQKRKAAPLAIKQAFREALELFSYNPSHPALRNHSLTGKYQDFRSIDVTDDWRALYRTENERIIFVDFGTHVELYG